MKETGIYLKSEYRAALEMLDDAERGQLLLRLFDVAKTGDCFSEDLTPAACVILAFIGDNVRQSREGYLARCEVNRANAARRWHGKSRESKTAEG